MNMPFTPQQFLDVFASYNRDVWPMQIVLNAAAVAAILLAFRASRISGRIIGSIVTFLWLWIGIVYQLHYFLAINPAALAFGILFIIQGLLFAYAGIIRGSLTYGWPGWKRGTVAVTLLLYGLLIYPILGSLSGHVYPYAPTFGLPCPTTIFTFGLLLLTVSQVPRYLLIVPSLWALLGFTAAIGLGIREDIGLLVAALIGTPLLLWGTPKGRDTQSPTASA